MPCLLRSGHEPLSEQRGLATGGGNTRAPTRRPGRRTGSERGLDGSDDELRGLRVNDNVPAEQHAADDLPGVRERVAWADGGGTGTGGGGTGAPPVIVSPTVRFTTRKEPPSEVGTGAMRGPLLRLLARRGDVATHHLGLGWSSPRDPHALSEGRLVQGGWPGSGPPRPDRRRRGCRGRPGCRGGRRRPRCGGRLRLAREPSLSGSQGRDH